jgi:hypothetical protein
VHDIEDVVPVLSSEANKVTTLSWQAMRCFMGKAHLGGAGVLKGVEWRQTCEM